MKRKYFTEYQNSITVAIGTVEKDIDFFMEQIFDEEYEEATYSISINDSLVSMSFDDEENAEWYIQEEIEKLFNIPTLKVRVYIDTEADVTIIFYDDENDVIISTPFDDDAFVYDYHVSFSPLETYIASEDYLKCME